MSLGDRLRVESLALTLQVPAIEGARAPRALCSRYLEGRSLGLWFQLLYIREAPNLVPRRNARLGKRERATLIAVGLSLKFRRSTGRFPAPAWQGYTPNATAINSETT